MFSESKRQLVHILLLFLAFLLRYTTRWQAIILLLVLFLMTLVLVPKMRFKTYFYRNTEQKYSEGAVLYFLVLLVLVIIFPLPVVAASWAILALGDGTATLIGKNFKCKELPWNRHKSYIGSLSFFAFGTFGAFILLQWMMPWMDPQAALSVAAKTALIAAIVESLPLRINDNVSVTIVSAVVLSFLKIG